MHNVVANQAVLKAGRKVKMYAVAGAPTLHVDTLIGWWRRMKKEEWKNMVADRELMDKYGQAGPSQRSRMPNEWSEKLNAKLEAECLVGVYKKRGRPSYLDKHPEFLACVKERDDLHESVRKQKRGADQEGFQKSLGSVVELKNAELSDNGEAQMQGMKLSRALVQTLLEDLSAKTQATGSTEPKYVEPEDREAYWKEYKEKLERVGDVRCQQTWDEFNGFKDRVVKRVLVHRTEDPDRQGHVKQTSGGRLTWTGGVVYGPLHKGKAFYLASNIPKDSLN